MGRGWPRGQRSRSAGVPVLSRLAALVAALMVVFVAGGVCVWQAGLASNWISRPTGDKVASAPRVSIVALPFTTDLSRLPDSFVIARNTAFTYKGKSVNAKQIGRELGVRYIVQGSLQRIGETISVNGQLVSVETGAQLWADQFEGDRRDLGELRVEFASGLANSLGIELIKAESLRALRERPDNPDLSTWPCVVRSFFTRSERGRVSPKRSNSSSVRLPSIRKTRAR